MSRYLSWRFWLCPALVGVGSQLFALHFHAPTWPTYGVALGCFFLGQIDKAIDQ